MNIDSRLRKIEKQINGALNRIEFIDIHFKDAGKVTSILRLWVDVDRDREEYTPKEYERTQHGT
ncbi:MAG: hypothetical protein JW913_02045 [Chitinispirillaceae bacterium]|nr:hypothetical protein [Chitinispirillaceae bacterium]